MKYNLLILLFLSFNVAADTCQVSFTAPSQYTDNSPLPPSEIASFKFVKPDGTQTIPTIPGASRSFDVSCGGQTRHIVTVLKNGVESALSVPVVVPVSALRPKPIEDTTVINISITQTP